MGWLAVGLQESIFIRDGTTFPHDPHGVACFPAALTAFQAYDIKLFLDLPRSSTNYVVGNFMLDVTLLSSAPPPGFTDDRHGITPVQTPTPSVIARSRRPAILPYVSPIVDAANTLTGLLWIMIGWKKESEVLEILMFEGVEFEKGRKKIPQAAVVKIESGLGMRFNEVRIEIVAKLRGLRYVEPMLASHETCILLRVEAK